MLKFDIIKLLNLNWLKEVIMRTKTMKSIIAVVACIAIMLVAGFVMTACGGTSEKLTKSDTVNFNGATFDNTNDLTLTKNSKTNIYEVTGTLAKMNDSQIRAWFGLAEDADTSTYTAYYACITIDMAENSMTKRGWIATQNTDQMLTEDNCVRYKYKSSSGSLDLVLGFIPQGDSYDLSATPIFRVEVEAPVANGEEPVEPEIYMIDFSKVI